MVLLCYSYNQCVVGNLIRKRMSFLEDIALKIRFFSTTSSFEVLLVVRKCICMFEFACYEYMPT